MNQTTVNESPSFIQSDGGKHGILCSVCISIDIGHISICLMALYSSVNSLFISFPHFSIGLLFIYLFIWFIISLFVFCILILWIILGQTPFFMASHLSFFLSRISFLL